jgi:hypothetical protein
LVCSGAADTMVQEAPWSTDLEGGLRKGRRVCSGGVVGDDQAPIVTGRGKESKNEGMRCALMMCSSTLDAGGALEHSLEGGLRKGRRVAVGWLSIHKRQ